MIARGQFAVTATSGIAARLIRWATRSTVNHAILCVGDGGECVEATPRGVKTTNASAYPRAIWSDEDITDDQTTAICRYGTTHLGEEYGWVTIAAIVLELAHIKPRWLLRWLRDPDSVICSELVARAYDAAGITLVSSEYIGRVRPDELLAVINQTHSHAVG